MLRGKHQSLTLFMILLCLQTGASCPLRGSTEQLTQTETDTHSQTVDGAWGLLQKKKRNDYGAEGDRNSTGRLTESTNLYPWGPQSLNHQPKNIHRLDLGLPAHMQQMSSLVFMWVPNIWSKGYHKSCCLYSGYFVLPGMPCLASVGEEVPSCAET